MSEIEERVKQIIVDKLGVSESEVTPEATFSEKQFDIKIPDDKSETIQNVGDAIKFIEEAKAAE